MHKIKHSIKKYKNYLLVGVPVLLLVLYFVSGTDSKKETFLVESIDIEQSVVLSGKVTTSDKADLGFATSGRLARIFVKNNQSVSQGQILAQLEIEDLLADLKIKQANLRVSDLDLKNAKEELEQVTAQEETKVESAYRTLVSDDLVLIPNSSNYEVETPIVTGIYNGPEGQYKIIISQENVSLSDFEVLTFNLEKTKKLINEEGSTLLGTKGLYISFPDDNFSSYKNTTWFLDIPNKASSSYLENFNAYNEAKRDRDLAVTEAEFAYKKLLSEKEEDLSGVAGAELQKINAEIRKNTIYAPFAGIVTNIEKELGENASTGERVISVLGEKKLEVVLQVSELDVSKLIPDGAVTISIDAFPEESFQGAIKTVNSRETEIDGVPVYEAFVELEPDPRIKTGMSASGSVVLATKSDVLAVPSYLIIKEGNESYVEVVGQDGEIEKRKITTGLLGSDSMVEITSGLSLGEKIVFDSSKK